MAKKCAKDEDFAKVSGSLKTDNPFFNLTKAILL